MLTIYNFSFHKSPQQGYDRQKKKGKTTISPLLTFNLKVGFTFSVLSKYRVPTMQNHLGDLTQPPSCKSFYHQAVFHVFVFAYIDDSASPMPDPTPHKFSRIIFVNKTTI